MVIIYPIEEEYFNLQYSSCNHEKLYLLLIILNLELLKHYKLATFDDTIKMSCVDDSIVFKSTLQGVHRQRQGHLPTEYMENKYMG